MLANHTIQQTGKGEQTLVYKGKQKCVNFLMKHVNRTVLNFPTFLPPPQYLTQHASGKDMYLLS